MRDHYPDDYHFGLIRQFVDQFMKRRSGPALDEEAFERLWREFIAEIEAPEWVYRGVANVRWCAAEGIPYDLSDGVTLRERSLADLTRLGCVKPVLERLWAEDKVGFPGASPYVIVVESRVEKSPKNRPWPTGAGNEWRKAQRALTAMRLLTRGDITLGRMWTNCVAQFIQSPEGFGTAGFSFPTRGSAYQLTDFRAARVPELCTDLRELEAEAYYSVAGNLRLAFESFVATYDRWPSSGDSRILDAITALEALLGSTAEIAFKLSFRVAGILAANDDDRIVLFNNMKAYYDLRSRLVHGTPLRDRHRALLADHEQLREIVRQLLRGFMHLAVRGNPTYGKQFFQDQLDAELQHEAKRAKLRRALGLSA
jgi:hypothetical protein